MDQFFSAWNCYSAMGFPSDSEGKESACTEEDQDLIFGSGRSSSSMMTTHSSILLGIPWTEEPGGLQSIGHKELDMTKQLTLTYLCVASKQ